MHNLMKLAEELKRLAEDAPEPEALDVLDEKIEETEALELSDSEKKMEKLDKEVSKIEKAIEKVRKHLEDLKGNFGDLQNIEEVEQSLEVLEQEATEEEAKESSDSEEADTPAFDDVYNSYVDRTSTNLSKELFEIAAAIESASKCSLCGCTLKEGEESICASCKEKEASAATRSRARRSRPARR